MARPNNAIEYRPKYLHILYHPDLMVLFTTSSRVDQILQFY